MASKESIPWTNRRKLGFVAAAWQTIKQVLFKPGEFFSNLVIEDSYAEPLYFYLIITIPVVSISMIYAILFNKGKNVSVPSLLFFLVFSLLGIFIVTALLHLGVLLFRGKGGFKGTFNILAYASATNIFCIIPFIGGIISWIWGIVVGVIGVKRIHKLSTIKALFAYWFFPLVFVVLLVITIAIPSLSRARLAANEEIAKAKVQMIATAVESYASNNNGEYPEDEYDLRFSGQAYLKESYNNKTINGYTYSLNLNPERYEITATPSGCGSTGIKIFKAEKDKEFSEESCK